MFRSNSARNRRIATIFIFTGIILAVFSSCGDAAGLVNTIIEEVTIVAAPTYTLTMQEDATGSLTPKGDITVKQNVAQNIIIEPATGYHFVGWTVEAGDGVEFGDSTSANTTVTLTVGDATIAATCDPFVYTLTVNQVGTGTTNVTGAVTVDHGASTTLTATPGTGYVFDTWTVTSGTASLINPTSQTIASVICESDATIEANFILDTHTLTITTVGSGTTTPASSASVDFGVSTPLTATPAIGYSFTTWAVVSGSAILTDPTSASAASIVCDGDATIEATFTINSYNLTLQDDGNGTVTAPASSPISVDHGVGTALSVNAAAGYQFKNWTVVLGAATFDDDTSPTASVACTENTTIQANFEIIPQDIGVDQAGAPIVYNTSGYDYGEVLDDGTGGYTFGAVSFSAQNIGGAFSTLSVTNISLLSGDTTDFVLGGSTTGSLTFGQTVDFTIDFDPTATGTRTATVAVDTDDADTPQFVFTVTGIGKAFAIEMVSVLGETFIMGENVETTTPSVTISNFNMGKYEITYAEWALVYDWATTRGVDPYTFNNVGQKGSSGSGSNLEPVTNINWLDAMAWCNAASEYMGLDPVYYEETTQSTVFRDATNTTADITDVVTDSNACVKWAANGFKLPTEAQWEYAARYIDGSLWTNGTYGSGATGADPADFNSVGWSSANATSTNDVGGKIPNALGIYDMSGNVFEACWDWYVAAYSAGPLSDPTGSGFTGSTTRVFRGGSYFVPTVPMQTALHTNTGIDHSSADIHYGFRVVQ